MKKEMVLLSEKGKKISIKTEVALSSMKPFGKWPVEYEEEASKRKYEVIGTNIETEYEEMDPEEESEVRKLTKEELEIYQQYKEFYTIQGRTKSKRGYNPETPCNFSYSIKYDIKSMTCPPKLWLVETAIWWGCPGFTLLECSK